jgi:hypothetical protein
MISGDGVALDAGSWSHISDILHNIQEMLNSLSVERILPIFWVNW